MMDNRLNRAVRVGDLAAVREILRAGANIQKLEAQGRSPLATAIDSDAAGPEMLRLLLEFGAEVEVLVRRNLLQMALEKGDPAKLKVLLAQDVDIQGIDGFGYDALIRALHGRDIARDPHLLDFLSLLIDHRVPLNGESKYGESALSVLSCVGRFDAIRVLLNAGANPAPLRFTSLIEATALGNLEDVARRLQEGAALEDRDGWERTAWLVAVQLGDLPKAQLLKDRGANVRVRGRCGKTALVHAIEAQRPDMVRWLIGIGADIAEADDFGHLPMQAVVEEDALECVDLLLKAGAASTKPLLEQARSRAMILKLLEAGADLADLSQEGRRVFVGLPPDGKIEDSELSSAEFLNGRNRRFGARNPDPMNEPFWIAMIWSGVSGYAANQHFGGPTSEELGPVWCASRFGQSITVLPDVGVVQIGGEHEDFYDPDFCIYNDVFVHGPDGSLCIFGYPDEVFPPTDFHTATLVGRFIYVIGSLGYRGTRRYGTTPLFRLDAQSFQMERLTATGDGPGWIHGHRADLVSPREIRVRGGKVCARLDRNERETTTPNSQSFVLDLEQLVWRRE